MKKQINLILSSAQEFKNTKSLVILSLLMALNIVIGFFTVTVTPTLKIGFSFLANAVAGYLFGPIPAALSAGLCDILKYLMRPDGPYFPGFTISAFMGGLIYGLFFYKKKITMIRCIGAKTFISVFVNMGLNTLWLSILTSKYFLVLLPLRVTKNIVAIPFEVVILYTFLKKIIEPNKDIFPTRVVEKF